jgi:hypothetical protein
MYRGNVGMVIIRMEATLEFSGAPSSWTLQAEGQRCGQMRKVPRLVQVR